MNISIQNGKTGTVVILWQRRCYSMKEARHESGTLKGFGLPPKEETDGGRPEWVRFIDSIRSRILDGKRHPHARERTTWISCLNPTKGDGRSGTLTPVFTRCVCFEQM